MKSANKSLAEIYIGNRMNQATNMNARFQAFIAITSFLIEEKAFNSREELRQGIYESFVPTKRDIAMREFLLEWWHIGNAGVPFEAWQDVAERGLALVEKFLADDSLESVKDVEGYDDFIAYYKIRYNEIKNSAEYSEYWANHPGFN